MAWFHPVFSDDEYVYDDYKQNNSDFDCCIETKTASSRDEAVLR